MLALIVNSRESAPGRDIGLVDEAVAKLGISIVTAENQEEVILWIKEELKDG